MATTFEATLRLKGSDETAAAFQSAAQNARRMEVGQKEASRSMTKDIEGVGRAYRNFGRAIGMAGTVKLITDAVGKAAEFEGQLNKIGVAAGLSQEEMKKFGEALREEALRINEPVAQVTAGFNAWRVASGQSAEEAMRTFPLVADLAKRFGADISQVGTFAGNLRTNLKLTETDMVRLFDMISDIAGDIGVPFEVFMENFKGYSEELQKLGMTGVAGAQQTLALFNVIMEQTKDAPRSFKILDEMLKKSTDSTFLNTRFVGGLRGEMKRTGEGMLEIFTRLISESKLSENALRELFGEDIFALIQNMGADMGAFNAAIDRTNNSTGHLNRSLEQTMKSRDEDIKRLKNSFDQLLGSLGDIGLAIDNAMGTEKQGLIGDLAEKLGDLGEIIRSPAEAWEKGKVTDLLLSPYRTAQRAVSATAAAAARLGGHEEAAAEIEQYQAERVAAREALRTGSSAIGPQRHELAPVSGMQRGGPAEQGQPVIVGERGPELFVPRVAGRIVPEWQPSASQGQRGADRAAIGRMQPRAAEAFDTEPIEDAARATRSNTGVMAESARQGRTLNELLTELNNNLREQNDEYRKTRGEFVAGGGTFGGAGATATWEGAPPPAAKPISGAADIRAREAQAMEYFQQQGWTHAQASGIVANLLHESKFDPRAVGDRGLARGIAQWHPARQQEISAAFGKPVTAMSFEEQLAAVQWEKTQGARLEREAGQRLRGAATPHEAGGIVSRYYERPARTAYEMQARGATAQRIAATHAPIEQQPAEDSAAQAQAARAEMSQPITIPVEFEYNPGEPQRMLGSLRHNVDREVRESKWNSYADDRA